MISRLQHAENDQVQRIGGVVGKAQAIGIDIRKVVKTGIPPIIDTAMAHKEPGHPIIGAGLVRPPLECFQKALKRFAEACGVGQ